MEDGHLLRPGADRVQYSHMEMNVSSGGSHYLDTMHQHHQVQMQDPQYHHHHNDGGGGGGEALAASRCERCLETEIGPLLKTVTLGGSDGIFVCTGIVCGAAGAELDPLHVLVLGVAGLVALALSQGINEFLSVRAHNLYVLGEYQFHRTSFQHRRAEEVDSAVRSFVEGGVSQVDAEEVVGRLSRYEGFFLNHVIMPHKGRLLMPPEEELSSLTPLVKEAFSMFLAILFVGALPLLTSYLALTAAHDPKSNDALLVFYATAGAILFGLGVVKSFFVQGLHWCLSGSESMLVGAACGVAGFWAGVAVSSVLHLPHIDVHGHHHGG